MKNIIIEMRAILEVVYRLDEAEDQTSNLEDKWTEITQSEQQKKKKRI